MEVTKFLVEEDISKRLRDYRELVEKLFILRDQGSYDDYFLQFVEMVMPFERFFTPGYEEIVEEELMYFFVEGLQKETKLYVYELGPTGLLNAMNMANYYEDVVKQEKIKEEEDLERQEEVAKEEASIVLQEYDSLLQHLENSDVAEENLGEEVQPPLIFAQCCEEKSQGLQSGDRSEFFSTLPNKKIYSKIKLPTSSQNNPISHSIVQPSNFHQNPSFSQQVNVTFSFTTIPISPFLQTQPQNPPIFNQEDVRYYDYKHKIEMGTGQYVMELMVSSGNTPDTSTYTFLVNQLCKRGNVGYAMQLVDKMDDYGCPPTTVTYNSLIRGLCIHGNLHQSLQLMEKLMHRGLIPNVFTFSFLLEDAYKERGADEAVRILDEIITKGGKPNLVSYNVLLTGFSKEGHLEDATKFFRVLPSKGFKPNVVSYNILLRSLCYDGRWEEAEELLDEMNSNNCSSKSGEVWMVIVQKLFDEMPKRDVFPWAILIDGYEKIDGDIHGARELFDNVREKNVLIFDLGGGYISLPLAEIPRPVTTVTDRPSISALTNCLYNVLVHLEEGFGVILPYKRSLPKPPWSYLKSSFCRTPSMTTSSRSSPKPLD